MHHWFDIMPIPIMLLLQVHLDVLSFVEPRTSLVLQSAPNSASRADYLADVLQSHKSDSFNKVKNREYKDWKLAMEIPTRKAPTGGVYSFEKITSKSQALWRSESWNEASKCNHRIQLRHRYHLLISCMRAPCKFSIPLTTMLVASAMTLLTIDDFLPRLQKLLVVCRQWEQNVAGCEGPESFRIERRQFGSCDSAEARDFLPSQSAATFVECY